MSRLYRFEPDYAVHPGETLKELLDEKGISPREFAVRVGKPEKTISQILHGKSAVTPEMAVQFENVLHLPASFWMKKQASYDEYRARKKQEELLENHIPWMREFPYAEMVKRGWVNATRKPKERVKELLHFFQISHRKAWEDIYLNGKLKVAFRQSLANQENPYAVSVLLRAFEKEASAMPTPPYDKKRLKEALPVLKQIMMDEPEDMLAQIRRTLAEAGVRTVFIPHLKQSPVYGAVKYVGDHPAVLITDRHKRYDIFWFTLFHELGHILLHGKKKAVFLEYNDRENPEAEAEADRFAEEILLSRKDFEHIEKELLGSMDDKRMLLSHIRIIAEKYATHKDIITGRLLKNNKELYRLGLIKDIRKIGFEN